MESTVYHRVHKSPLNSEALCNTS